MQIIVAPKSSSRGSADGAGGSGMLREREAFRQSNFAPPHRKMPTRTSLRLDTTETLKSTTLRLWVPTSPAAEESPFIVHRSPETCSRANTYLRNTSWRTLRVASASHESPEAGDCVPPPDGPFYSHSIWSRRVKCH